MPPSGQCLILFLNQQQGNKKVLSLFGFKSPVIKRISIDVQTAEVVFGTALQFSVSITSNAGHDQALMIDYMIHHQKANGKTTPKVFKWRTKSLLANTSLSLTKQHSMKKITTRAYYPGLHSIEVMVNGVSVGSADFQLLMPVHKKPREGWAEAAKRCHERGDDKLLIPDVFDDDQDYH